MRLKKMLSVILVVCMIFGIMPASVHANGKEIEIRTIEEFVDYLSKDGDVELKVVENMIHTTTAESAGSYWITLGAGKKNIDLNGCSVELNAETGMETTMLRVPEGTKLTVNDSSGDHSGKLFCYGKIESPGDYGLYYQNNDVKFRNVVEVDGGELVVYGGMLEAGRSKQIWIYDGCDITDWHWQLGATMIGGALGKALGCRFDGYAYQQINGDCITLNDGRVTIVDGVFYGRGYSQLKSYISDDVRFEVEGEKAAVLRAIKGTLNIYGGEFYARGNADVFVLSNKAYSGGDVDGVIRDGIFKTQYLKVINVPSYTTAIINANHAMVMGKSKGATKDIMKFQPELAHVGDINLPIDALSVKNHVVEIEGEVIPMAEWSPKTLQDTSGDEGGITLTLNYVKEKEHANVDTRIPIPSVEVIGTVAKGVILTKDFLTCDAEGIRKMKVEWYRNGVALEEGEEVFEGNYQARVTLVADTGYRFNGSTVFELTGSKPALKMVASTGRSVEIWSTYHRFACDHNLNEDYAIHFDEKIHYQQCTVCGEKIIEEEHLFHQGILENGTMKYDCGICDYYVERFDNGKTKVKIIQMRLPEPVVGEKPKYDASILIGEGVSVSQVNDIYTSGGVTWTKAGTGWELEQEELFVGNFKYKAIVQLEFDEEHALSQNMYGDYDTEIYVNGTPAQYEVTTGGIKVFYEYVTEEVLITSVDVYGIDEPKIGEKPDYDVQVAAPQYYEVNYVWWYDSDGSLVDSGNGKFEDGKIYTVEIDIDPTRIGWDDVAVFDKESLRATVNGYTVTDGDLEWIGNRVRLRFTFVKLKPQMAWGSVDVSTAFGDVKESSWYEPSVQYVYDSGLMSGSNGMFNPTSDITRAQIVTTIYRLAGEPKVTDFSALEEFSDVTAGKYYTDAVCWAYAKGIATGNNGKFDPTGKLTRQQMASFFFRYVQYVGLDNEIRADFSDMINAEKVSGYAEEPVAWAVGAGLISGSDVIVNGNKVKDLNPRGNTTRAQVATILMRFSESID